MPWLVHLSRIFLGKRSTSSCLASAGRWSARLMGSKDEERSATELLDMHDLMFGGPSPFHSSESNHRIWKEMVTMEEDAPNEMSTWCWYLFHHAFISDSKNVTRKSCMIFLFIYFSHSCSFFCFFVFVARHHKNALAYKHLHWPNHSQKVKSKAGISQSFSHSRQYNKNKIVFTHCKQHK